MGAPAKGSGATRVGAKFRDIHALGLSKKLLSQVYEMLVRYAEESTPRDECEDGCICGEKCGFVLVVSNSG